MIKQVEFLNGENLVLKGKIHEPKNYKTAVIILHGFLGNCEYNIPLNLANDLEKRGFLVLRFNFSNTDSSEGFLKNKTISSEVRDIKYAIDFLETNYSFENLILIGHSSGAIDAALYAYKDSRISKLILLSGVGNLKDAVRYDFTEEQIKDLSKKGFFTLKCEGKWYNNQEISKTFYEEYFKLDVLRSLNKFINPTLIIHSKDDNTVSVKKDPLELYNSANEPKELFFVERGGHRFLDKSSWRKIIKKIIEFISQ